MMAVCKPRPPPFSSPNNPKENTLNKDESIITQVAAKIAAELASSVKPTTIEFATADWAVAFDIVRDSIFASINGNHAVTQPAPVAPVAQVAPNHITDVAMQQVQEVFPTAHNPAPAQAPAQVPAQAPTNMSVQVKGTQHGELPDWLVSQCVAAGVTQVWDNRDGLAINPKRPWFKAADGTKNSRGDDMAFWPPRGK